MTYGLITRKLLYGLEVCPLTASDLRALDFVVNSLFIKLFTTNVMDTLKMCQDYCDFLLCKAAPLRNGEIHYFVVRYDNYCY